LQWEFKKEDFKFTKHRLISKEEIPAGLHAWGWHQNKCI
jgi:hypothetical protein